MEYKELTKKDILADMHTHTIFSLHGISTIKENVTEAKEKGLRYLATTDHFINYHNDVLNQHQIFRSRIIRENQETDIKIINGFEFNIGQEVYNKRAFRETKWHPIGYHSVFLEEKCSSLEELYQLYKNLPDCYNGFVHIERSLYDMLSNEERKNPNAIYDYLEKIVILAKEKDIYLEVNELSLTRGNNDLVRYWLTFARENGNKIYLGTDAHYCDLVGDFTQSIKLINELKYPRKLILNCNEELLERLSQNDL